MRKKYHAAKNSVESVAVEDWVRKNITAGVKVVVNFEESFLDFVSASDGFDFFHFLP